MMRSVERHSLILSLLQAQEHVSIEAMASACGTSLQTIRRDLEVLGKEGRIRRYHGGAKLAEQPVSASYEARSSSHIGEKEIAARLVVDLIPDGATLFLAGGSTLALAATRLREREGLTIITNNVHAAVALFDRPGFEIHVAGGMMRPASGSMTGDEAVRFLKRYSVDFALIGTCGIDLDGALLEYDHSLVSPVMAMIANARETILVADSSKFGARGIVRGAHLRNVDTLVTDMAPHGRMAELIAAHDIRIHSPGHKSDAATSASTAA